MATPLPPTTICDAGPIIHLAELDCLDLLADFPRLLVPNTVRDEVNRHQPTAIRRLPPHSLVDVTAIPTAQLRQMTGTIPLHDGERAAILLSLHERPALLLCDDLAARLVAEELGIRVHGTIGIIVRAIRRNQRTKVDVLRLLRDIPMQSTLYVRPTFLADIVRQVEDS